jgi:hypothetical protein
MLHFVVRLCFELDFIGLILNFRVGVNIKVYFVIGVGVEFGLIIVKVVIIINKILSTFIIACLVVLIFCFFSLR